MQFSYFGSVVLKVRFKQHLFRPAEQKRPSNIASPEVIDKIPPPLIALITVGAENELSCKISEGGKICFPRAFLAAGNHPPESG